MADLAGARIDSAMAGDMATNTLNGQDQEDHRRDQRQAVSAAVCRPLRHRSRFRDPGAGKACWPLQAHPPYSTNSPLKSSALSSTKSSHQADQAWIEPTTMTRQQILRLDGKNAGAALSQKYDIKPN